MSTKSLLISLLAISLPIVLAAPITAESVEVAARTPNRASGENLFKPRADSCPNTSSDAPHHYTGPYTSFPSINQWIDFTTMFNDNKPLMLSAGSTHQDVGYMWNAIEDASADIGIDPRVILGIIMEESHGYVGVETTYDADGVPTGGLMQASGCNGYPGQNGLSQSDISNMVNCGSTHYKQNLEDWGNAWATSSILPALREYNSGSVITSDLSNAPNCVGNPYYVSDISNRFLGATF